MPYCSSRIRPQAARPSRLGLPVHASIYVLIDPRTHEVRYVGKARDPLIRWKGHLKPERRRDTETHRAKWIAQLRRQGYTPVLEVVQTLREEDAYDAERYWISYYRGLGCALTNGTDGGPGGVTTQGRRMTPEHREKISTALRGKPAPRRSNGRRGKPAWNRGLRKDTHG